MCVARLSQSRYSKFPEHELDQGEEDEGAVASWVLLAVFGQAPLQQ